MRNERLEALSEPELVELAEQALTLLHTRYRDEQTLIDHFGEAAADYVRLAIENAHEGFDRFADHYWEREPEHRARSLRPACTSHTHPTALTCSGRGRVAAADRARRGVAGRVRRRRDQK